MKRLISISSHRIQKNRDLSYFSLRPIWWVIGALVAALGFILFSPIQIFDTITNGHLINLYRQNRQIEQTIADIHQSIQESEKQLQEASSLRDSSIKLSGLISPVADIEKIPTTVLAFLKFSLHTRSFLIP